MDPLVSEYLEPKSHPLHVQIIEDMRPYQKYYDQVSHHLIVYYLFKSEYNFIRRTTIPYLQHASNNNYFHMKSLLSCLAVE